MNFSIYKSERCSFFSFKCQFPVRYIFLYNLWKYTVYILFLMKAIFSLHKFISISRFFIENFRELFSSIKWIAIYFIFSTIRCRCNRSKIDLWSSTYSPITAVCDNFPFQSAWLSARNLSSLAVVGFFFSPLPSWGSAHSSSFRFGPDRK